MHDCKSKCRQFLAFKFTIKGINIPITDLFLGQLFFYNKGNKDIKQSNKNRRIQIMGFIAAVGIALLFPEVIKSIGTAGSSQQHGHGHKCSKSAHKASARTYRR